MGKASISIAVTGSYNGAALERAEKRLDSIAIKTAGASKGLGGMSSQLVEHGSQLASLGGDIYNTGAQIEGAGQKMMGVSAIAVGLGVVTGAAAVKIDTALTGVRKTVDGTDEQYQQLKESAIEFSKTNAVSPDQILDIQALGAQLGFSIEELDGFSRVVSGLDIATDMDADTAATQLAQFANVTRMSHDEVSNYGSAIVNLGNHMATTESAISSMGQRIAASSTQVGMSQADILGWSAAMSSMGIEAEAGGTAFSTTVSTIDAAVATGGDSLDAFAQVAGMSADDFRTAWQTSASDTLVSILKGTDGAENMTVALENMGVTGIRQSDVLKRLAGNTDLVTQALQVSNDGWRQNTALTDEVANRNGSMAAKLEILQNKLTAIAEDVGTPLVTAVTDAIDASQPLIDVVEGASQGFSDMDTGSQRVAIGLGVAVAAAGPFLSVTGKIVKVAGDVATGVGRAQQEVGVYADALTTTDAAALEAYQKNDKLAGALRNNGAVKAAGDVDTYVGAVRNANADTSEYERAVRKLADEQRKGSSANKDLVDNLTSEVAAKKRDMDASTGLVSGYRSEAAASAESTTATRLHAVGLATMTTAANVAKVALATIAPMAVIAGITMLVGAFTDAQKHAGDLSAATDGLTAASSGATTEAGKEAGVLDVLSGSASGAKADIDGMLESQAQLAQTITDTNNGAAAQSAQLQAAYSTIQEYANQSDLSTDAQGRLRSAVETVNDMCGTQITVTDAANGMLSDENGAIDDVTGSLGDYVEKKLEQIKVDAQQQNLSGLYQQQATDITALAQAQSAWNDAVDRYTQGFIDQGYAQDEAARMAVVEAQANQELSGTVEEAQGALDACSASIDNVTTSLGASVAISDGASQGIQNVATASTTVSTALNAVGGDIGQFSSDLSDAGVSVSDFKSLNDTQLTQLVTSWDGTTQSIVDALAGMGVDMSDSGLSAANALASGMESGEVSVDSATAVLQAAASGDWSGVASQMEAAGIDLPQSVADGISANGFVASGATDEMLSEVALRLTGGDVDAAAQLLGHDIDAGLADGIRNGTLSAEQSTMLGQDVIDAAKTSLDSHSPSQKFYQLGTDVDTGLQLGISGNESGPLGAVSALGASLLGALSGMPGQMAGTGASSSGSLASGIGSGVGAVFASAASLAERAGSGVSGTSESLLSIGKGAGASFASGVGSGRGATSGSARGLASAAQDARDYGDPYLWGSDLGANFASGIRSARGWVASAASAIASAAQSILHFSAPEEGPWSGAEKGGVRSGMHLAQNFAAGMRIGSADVEDAALRLAEDASIDPEATARPTRQGGWYGYGGSKDTGLPTYGNTYYYSIVVDGRTVSSSRRLEGAVRELAALAASGSDY